MILYFSSVWNIYILNPIPKHLMYEKLKCNFMQIIIFQ